MLTALRLVMPKFNDTHYSIMVEYCIERSRHYANNNELEKGVYWSKQACKYLLKRMDLLQRRGL